MTGSGSAVAEWARQPGSQVRVDWGPEGLRALGPVSDVVVVVDVLRFTTCVDVAVGRGASVHPFGWDDDGATDLARSVDAEIAGERWSLSPSGLTAIPAGTRLVLPSPNGSALSRAALGHGALVMAGCLRNATAVGSAAAAVAGERGTVGIVAAGERWGGGAGPLRPAVEDLWGAGAVAAAAAAVLGMASTSPEASAASASFVALDDVEAALSACASGRELIGRGRADDVALAAQVDVSRCVPTLGDGAFRDGAGDVEELGA